MNTALVIGAGRGQIPIINLCHEYDWKVIVVTPKGNYPGIGVADEVFFEDVRNYASILEYAKTRNIKAVLTDQLDVAVFTVAYVSYHLGLKSITPAVAKKFTNKYIMRNEANKAGIAVPKFKKIKNLDNLGEALEGIKFPLMIKPVDSDASRGVYKVTSIDELKDKYELSKSYSKTGEVILEEYIEGNEYVVDAFTQNRKTRNLVVGHREYFNIEGAFIPSATLFVDANSACSRIENMIKENNEKVIHAFGLQFGITHAEFIYNQKEDKVYLVEIAARGGGVFISSDLIPTACGVDANDLYVREVLGIYIKDEISLKRGASAYFCYLVTEGTVYELNGLDEVEKIPGVHKAFFDNIELGMQTNSIRDKSSRKGPILVKGKTKEECYQVIATVKKKLSIKIKTADGIEDILWN